MRKPSQHPRAGAGISVRLCCAALLTASATGAAAQQTQPSRYRIQVYAAKSAADALEVAGRVHEGLQRKYGTYVGARSIYHVVRVGDFPDARSAQPALREIRALGFADAWIAGTDAMRTGLAIAPGDAAPGAAAPVMPVPPARDSASTAATSMPPVPDPGPEGQGLKPATAVDGNGAAATAAFVRKQTRATPLEGSLHLDGRLDEPAWQTAVFVSDFQQRGKDRGYTPWDSTKVAFLFDRDALYVGAWLPVGKREHLRELVSRRDEPGNAERLLVSFDTYRDRRTAYTFGVTIGGGRLDYHQARDIEGWKDDSFDPVWEAQTTSDSTGWAAELRIPFSQLRFESAEAPVWGLNIRRYNPATFLDAYWVMVPYVETGWASRFGEITGLPPLRGARGVEVMPWALAGASLPDSRFRAQGAVRETSSRVGADLKVGLAANLTLDATINPDFGQVEADPADVNLTAFETYFPELRPFFLEGREVFRSRGPLFFYSRRIGSVPAEITPREGPGLPTNTTILGAVKLTGRLPSGLSVGGLTAFTDREDATFIGQGGTLSRYPAAAPTAFGVLRLSQELGKAGSTAGVILTAVDRSFDGSSGLAQQLPRRAFAGGADWNLRLGRGQYELSGHAGFSQVMGDAEAIRRVQLSSAHFLQRPDARHVQLDPTRTSMSGHSLGLAISKFGGANWFWDAAVEAQSPGFEIRDAGSQNSADRVNANVGLRYHERDLNGLIKAYSVGATLGSTWDFGGIRQALSPGIWADLIWPNIWRSYLEVSYSARALSSDLTRGGPLMGTPSAVNVSASLHSSSQPKTQWYASTNTFFDEFGGWSVSADGGVTVLPGDRLRVSITPGFARSRTSRQYYMTVDSGPAATYGRRYVFSALDQTEFFLQLRTSLAISPDLSLELYGEPFAANARFHGFGELPAPRSYALRTYGTDGTTIARNADGDYDVRDDTTTFTVPDADFQLRSFRSNAVLRWEWRRGSSFHLIWQQNRWLYDESWVSVGPATLWKTIGDSGENILMAKLSYWLGF